MSSFKKGLYIVSTPIGNLEDISLRALSILKNSDLIYCEDTRHSSKLLNHYKIKKKLISNHKFNEKSQVTKAIEYLNQGKILSLVSDSGTPILSDPGNILVKECINKNINIYTIPGASAVTSALTCSGFDSKFLFYGFLPKKPGELSDVLKKLEKIENTLIFFVPAVKFVFYLKFFKKYFSDRKIVIAREMTKLHEEYIRDEVNNIDPSKISLKGELTVVISEKKNNKVSISNDELKKMVKSTLRKKSVKDTVQFVASKSNISKKIIYQLCLEINEKKNN
jgi:16S rRNA (cytidine1402-2'-O)-methyltransferase